MGRVVFLQRIMYEFGGPPLLASFLQECGYEVTLHIGEGVHQFVPHIANGDIIAFSIMSDDERWALSVANGLKQIFDVTIIMGGPHPTFFPNILEDPAVDFICRGEGERAIVDLANHIFKGIGDIESIRNIGYKKNDGTAVFNELACLISDLGTLPYPNRAIYYDSYPRLRKSILKPFLAGRGCPYSCAFCFNERYRQLYKGKGRYVRYRPIDHVIGEIDQVRKTYGLRTVLFSDDIFILDRDWLSEFCRHFKKKVNLPYVCCVRADLLNEEIAALLSESGCYSVYFGIESGNQEIRTKVLNKRITDEQIIQASELLHGHSIKFMTFNIIGSPGEAIENVYETIELNQKIRPHYPRCSLMAYLPNTRITEYAKEQGILPQDFQLSQFAQQWASDDRVHCGEMQNLHSFFQTAVLFPSLYPLIRKLSKRPPNRLFKTWWALVYFYIFTRGEKRNLLQTLTFGAEYVRDLLRDHASVGVGAEYFVCPSCGNNEYRVVTSEDTMQIVRCKRCRLEALHPKPDTIAYEKEYYDVWGGEELETETSDLKQRTSEALLEYFDLPAGAKILEVGCAKGDFVAVASQKGYDVMGIDVNRYAIQRAASRGYSAEFLACDVDEAVQWGRQYDAVVMIDVLEHVADPNAFLRSVNRLLSPNGLLLVLTPNTNAVGHRLLGKFWPHYKKEHLFYYSEESLSPLFERAGFRNLKSATIPKALNMRYICGNMRHYTRSGALQRAFDLFRHFEDTKIFRKPFRVKDGTFTLVARKKAEVLQSRRRRCDRDVAKTQ